MGDIFREVDEELKQERYERLWRQYGKYLIAAAVIVVAAVAAWQGWSSYRVSQQEAGGLEFSAATRLVREGRIEQAETAFATLSASAGYGVLSRFHQASIRAAGGDHASAVDIYDRLAADRDTPPSLRGLATVLAGLQALRVREIPPDAISDRIAPLTGPGAAYRHIAQEILAMVAQRAGDRETAVSYYRKLVDDAETPSGIRTRAAQMLNILGAS